MSLTQTLQLVPTFVLVFFRVTGLTIFAPLFGSSRVPRRIKLMLCLVMAAGMCGTVKAPAVLPETSWELAIAIAGEMAFGLAMGMALSFTFIAAQWAGEIMGQQMGLNMSEVLDPQFGQGGSLVGDLYFMLTLVIFLSFGVHRQMIMAVRMSFDALPLLSLGVDRSLFEATVGLMQSCTVLAMQLAAPMLVTMLVVDLALGCIGKAMPQINVMTAGLTVRSLLGLVVLIAGLAIAVNVIDAELNGAMNQVALRWTTAH
jgi:flagellar biosynthetic protein FliR